MNKKKITVESNLYYKTKLFFYYLVLAVLLDNQSWFPIFYFVICNYVLYFATLIAQNMWREADKKSNNIKK